MQENSLREVVRCARVGGARVDRMTNPSRTQRRSNAIWTATAVLLSLALVVLASLQYRWIDAVSEAERTRVEEIMDTGAAAFARDFDRLISHVALAFLAPATRSRPPTDRSATAGDDEAVADRHLVDRYRRWLALAPYPELIRALYRVELRRGDTPQLWAVDLETADAVPVEWPEALSPLASRFAGAPRARRLDRRRAGRSPAERRLSGLIDEPPSIAIPWFEGSTGPRDRRSPRPLERARPTGPAEILLVVFDRTTLEETILDDLAARHFDHGRGEAWSSAWTVVRRKPNDDGRPTAVRGRGFAAGETPDGDVEVDFFRLRPFDEIGRVAGHLVRAGYFGREAGARGRGLGYELMARASEARWRLAVRHPAGSVVAAVAAARRRNLALGLGIIAVLAGGLAVLWVANGRARRLARQQLEFVAGVTHELRTPVTAIRSAAQNLAHGVIEEPSKVRRYGEMIDHEAERLSGLLEQVLADAGLAAGSPGPVATPIDIEGLVTSSLASVEMLGDDVDVETDLPEDLPSVLGDAGALRRALENLIGNALKYGGGTWLRLAARRQGSGEVAIEVTDRGPGIARRDLARVFEPFVRGSNVDGIPGTGLGLSLVRKVAEAHGGRVTVASTPGVGTTFTLHLPAAPARA